MTSAFILPLSPSRLEPRLYLREGRKRDEKDLRRRNNWQPYVFTVCCWSPGASHFKLGQALVGLMIYESFYSVLRLLVSFREHDTGAGWTACIFSTIAAMWRICVRIRWQRIVASWSQRMNAHYIKTSKISQKQVGAGHVVTAMIWNHIVKDAKNMSDCFERWHVFDSFLLSVSVLTEMNLNEQISIFFHLNIKL